MTESEIPQRNRNYIIPGRTDIFEQDGKFFIYLGKWAGWQVADKVTIMPDGTVSGICGTLDVNAAASAACRILKGGLCNEKKTQLLL